MLRELHCLEIGFLKKIQAFRTPFLDEFFRTLNFFDTREFILILIPAIWYGYSQRTGIKFILILLFSGWLNYFLKKYFMSPRPGFYVSGLSLIKLSRSFGFPSGAAQQSFFLGALLFATYRTYWSAIVGGGYMLLISFSRIYLGVHFVSDVVGGWFVGVGLLGIYLGILPYFEKISDRITNKEKFFSYCFLLLIYCYLSPSSYTNVGVAVMLGLLIGQLFSSPLPKIDHIVRLGIRALIAVFGLLLIKYFPSVVLRSFLAGFWLSFGANYSIQTLEGFLSYKWFFGKNDDILQKNLSH